MNGRMTSSRPDKLAPRPPSPLWIRPRASVHGKVMCANKNSYVLRLMANGIRAHYFALPFDSELGWESKRKSTDATYAIIRKTKHLLKEYPSIYIQSCLDDSR